MSAGAERRIAVLGHGAIGSVVTTELAAGKVAGAVLAGVVLRQPRELPHPMLTLDEALEDCDVIVECAGQQVLREHAERILRAGVDLLVVSLGVMADPELAVRLSQAGPGRLFFTPGAVGGLDLLAAGAKMGAYDHVALTTRKLPATLIQPWMDPQLRGRLEASTEPLEVFTGTAAQAAQKFPSSLNIAAALALAIGDWDAVSVRLLADPQAVLTEHAIEARGASGVYAFTIRNRPFEHNGRTSGIVPYAVLRSLEALLGARGGMI